MRSCKCQLWGEKKNTGISLLNPDSWHHWRAQIHLSTSWQRVIKTEFAETLTPSLFFEWRFAINSLQRLCRKHINKRYYNRGTYSKCKMQQGASRKLLSNWLAWSYQCVYPKWGESAMTSKNSWIIQCDIWKLGRRIINFGPFSY